MGPGHALTILTLLERDLSWSKWLEVLGLSLVESHLHTIVEPKWRKWDPHGSNRELK